MTTIDPRDCEHRLWEHTGRWSKRCTVCGVERYAELWEWEDEQRKRRTNYLPPRIPKEEEKA